MKGMGRVFRRGQGWWIAYCHQGREYRESARSTSEEDARAFLRQRLEEIGQGRWLDRHLTFEELVPDYLYEHALRGERSLEWAEDRVAHLQRFFGRLKVVEITPSGCGRIRRPGWWKEPRQRPSIATLGRWDGSPLWPSKQSGFTIGRMCPGCPRPYRHRGS